MTTSSRRRTPLEQRFWSKVNKAGPDDCWLWTRSRTSTGYGQFKVQAGSSPQKASRVAWSLTHGPIPDGLVICHRCDNPPCCNPAHLFIGTVADNNADKVAKGRQPQLRPDFIAGFVEHVRHLTDDQIVEARQLHAAGESSRTIARRFGVHHTTIVRLTNGTHWKGHLEADAAA